MFIVGAILGVIALAIGVTALETWWVMLLLGNVHINVFSWVPALGFFDTFFVVLLLGALGAVFHGSLLYSMSTRK